LQPVKFVEKFEVQRPAISDLGIVGIKGLLSQQRLRAADSSQ
jgi:hypothetical protein